MRNRIRDWVKKVRSQPVSEPSALEMANQRLELTQTAAGLTSWEWNVVTDEMTWTAGRPNLVRLGEDETIRFRDAIANVHPEDREATLEAALAAVAGKKDYHKEFRVATPDGAIRWIMSRGKVFHDPSGKPVRMLGVNMDITDRKNLEASIVQDKELFRAIFEHTGVGVAYVVVKRQFHLVNQKFGAMLGYSQDEIVNKTVMDILHPDDRVPMSNLRDSMLASGGSDLMGEARFLRKDGTWFWGELTASRVHLDTVQPMLVIILKDITTRIKAEAVAQRAKEQMQAAMQAAEQANQAKTNFLANISHEIRTPLAAILGFSELLQLTAITEEQRKRYVDTIVRNGQALSQLINDILDLSKIEASRFDLRRTKEDVRSTVAHLRSTAAALAVGKQVELDFQCDDSVPALVYTDGAKLLQLLTNVVGNAVKFTHEGVVKLTVTAEREIFGTAVRLRFVVTDTGIGMSPDQLESLFLPFFQGDASMTRKYGGTGLGLTLARKLARLLGGELALVASELGKGSTFAADVLAELTDEGATIEPDSEFGVLRIGDDVRRKLAGVRVLLAEDAVDSKEYLASCLELGGVEVVVANDGAEAVTKASAGGFDVVLMDIQLPVLDGIEATRRLRRLGCKVPIIALTAHALSDERDRCILAGCDAHVTKPIRPLELLNLVAAAVHSKSLLGK